MDLRRCIIKSCTIRLMEPPPLIILSFSKEALHRTYALFASVAVVRCCYCYQYHFRVHSNHRLIYCEVQISFIAMLMDALKRTMPCVSMKTSTPFRSIGPAPIVLMSHQRENRRALKVKVKLKVNLNKPIPSVRPQALDPREEEGRDWRCMGFPGKLQLAIREGGSERQLA